MAENNYLPSDGIINWIQACRAFDYHCRGLHPDRTVFSKKLTDDLRIEIVDESQNSDYSTPAKPFATIITIFKKEKFEHSPFSHDVYERPFSIFYPYGTRFDNRIVVEATIALNALINKARDLSPELTGRLKEIKNAQIEIVDLFQNGMTDRHAISKIMKKADVSQTYGFSDSQIRIAKDKKDWLPFGLEKDDETLSLSEQRANFTQNLFAQFLKSAKNKKIYYYTTNGAIVMTTNFACLEQLHHKENLSGSKVPFFSQLIERDPTTLNSIIKNVALTTLESKDKNGDIKYSHTIVLSPSPQELKKRIMFLLGIHSAQTNTSMDSQKGLKYWFEDIDSMQVQLGINSQECILPQQGIFDDRNSLRLLPSYIDKAIFGQEKTK